MTWIFSAIRKYLLIFPFGFAWLVGYPSLRTLSSCIVQATSITLDSVSSNRINLTSAACNNANLHA